MWRWGRRYVDTHRTLIIAVLKSLHALIVVWTAFGWLCRTRFMLLTHAVTSASIAGSWCILGLCPLSLLTNRVECLPDNTPFIKNPIGTFERISYILPVTCALGLVSIVRSFMSV